MAAPTMGEENSDLATQCMAFCQALASKGQTFSFALNVGSSFMFSLDTRGNVSSTLSKKRKSPSTQRRNAKRRAEFLAKKRGPLPEIESTSVEIAPEKEPEHGNEKHDFKCGQCEKKFKSEKDLNIHIGKTHKKVDSESDLATPERPRQQPRSSVGLSASPLLNTTREESTTNNDIEEQKDEKIHSFISVLKTALVLWPEDEQPHRCPPWERYRNLKCRVKAEIENQEYAAAGECDDCGENVNDCECGS